MFSHQILVDLTTSLRRGNGESPKITSVETKFGQSMVIIEDNEELRVYLDGDIQFSSVDERRYHEALARPALVDKPREILILGGGDGLAAREALAMETTERVILIDPDIDVVKAARTNEAWNKLNEGAFTTARMNHIPMGAREFLELGGERYDAAIIDLPDPNSDELRKLYTKEFYALLKNALKPTARFTVQCSSPLWGNYWQNVRAIREGGWDVVQYWTPLPVLGDWGFALCGTDVEMRVPPSQGCTWFSREMAQAATCFPPMFNPKTT